MKSNNLILSYQRVDNRVPVSHTGRDPKVRPQRGAPGADRLPDAGGDVQAERDSSLGLPTIKFLDMHVPRVL